MIKLTITRALLACVGSALLLAACSQEPDPRSAFPDTVKERKVLLRDGPAREKTRIVHYTSDGVTPLWADITLTNDHHRVVYYENKVMNRSEEFFKPAEGQEKGPMYLQRFYMPDGRNLRKETKLRLDGSVEMEGERNADGTYWRSFYTPTHSLTRHVVLAQGGDVQEDSVYWDGGQLKQHTYHDGDLLRVDSFDQEGFPTESTGKDVYGYKMLRILYFPHSKQVRVRSEKQYYKSTVVVYRDDNSVSENWTRSNQTIVIDHLDRAGNVKWRQNLLMYRLRMGAPTQWSDWRVFSTDELDAKGVIVRRVLYNNDGTPKIVFYPTASSTDSALEGLMKTIRADGTVESVKWHNKDGSEDLRESHTVQENVRDPVDPSFTKMPSEDLSFDPGQMAIFRGPGGY